jgi:hypothetical protein
VYSIFRSASISLRDKKSAWRIFMLFFVLNFSSSWYIIIGMNKVKKTAKKAPKELEYRLSEEISRIEEEQKMPYVTSWERGGMETRVPRLATGLVMNDGVMRDEKRVQKTEFFVAP